MPWTLYRLGNYAQATRARHNRIQQNAVGHLTVAHLREIDFGNAGGDGYTMLTG